MLAATDAVIEHGRLRFTRERVEELQDGKRIASVGRTGVRSIVVKNQSAAEHPIHEGFWAAAAGVAALLVLASAWQSGEASSWIGGFVLGLATLLIVRHQLTTITVVELVTAEGRAWFELEERLAAPEILHLNRRLAEELGWPVRASALANV